MNDEVCDTILVCRSCDLILKKCDLKEKQTLACPRCGDCLCCGKIHSMEALFALVVTDLFLFIFSNIFPFMDFMLSGREQIIFLYSGAFELCAQGFQVLGILVFLTIIFFPMIQVCCLLYVIVSIRFNLRFHKSILVFKFLNKTQEWAMMEVLMLGIIVVYVKMMKIADIGLLPSFYFFVAFVLSMTMTSVMMDKDKIWEKLERLESV